MLIYWKILEICLTEVLWTMNELSRTLVETKQTFFVKIVHGDGGIENGEISLNPPIHAGFVIAASKLNLSF